MALIETLTINTAKTPVITMLGSTKYLIKKYQGNKQQLKHPLIL